MMSGQSFYQDIVDVSFTRNIGGKRIKPIYGQPATDHALDELDERLKWHRLTLPEEYIKFLRERNGFRGVDICFHGTATLTAPEIPKMIFQPVPEDERPYVSNPTRRDVCFSEGKTLLTFNLELLRPFSYQLDTQIALGEMVNPENRYLFTFDYSKKQYQRLKFKSNNETGISELTPDGSYSDLMTMFSYSTELNHILPHRRCSGGQLIEHKYVA